MAHTDPKPLYVILATMLQSRANCKARNNPEWFDTWSELIGRIEKGILPSGSGVDNGTKIDLDKSSDDQIVLTAGFHHMDENGMYDGWTDHTIRVRPSLSFGFTVSISGRNKNGIKEYLSDLYHSAMAEKYTHTFDTMSKTHDIRPTGHRPGLEGMENTPFE